ncbi:MAG: exodeoxyribonuclease VII small subunit [Aestuariivita sp.]|nr:exodeoxyribonuclease VII small subunit [Aestuariivita sp.]MCY4202372.1 exodeoxyribonuclease VII small subunit [Aestuariivita sp.]
MKKTEISELSFEAAMQELETVVAKLESGDIELDESISLFERGHALKRRCEEELKRAEERAEAITLDANGNPNGTGPLKDV